MMAGSLTPPHPNSLAPPMRKAHGFAGLIPGFKLPDAIERQDFGEFIFSHDGSLQARQPLFDWQERRKWLVRFCLVPVSG